MTSSWSTAWDTAPESSRLMVERAHDELLAGDDRFERPQLHPELVPAWYKYPVLLPASVDRNALRAKIYESERIEIGGPGDA